MEKEKMQDFIRNVITEACSIAGEGAAKEVSPGNFEKEPVSLAIFEKKLLGKISEYYNISEKVMKSESKIYIPFHWAFFDGRVTDSQKNNLSPFKLVPYGSIEQKPNFSSYGVVIDKSRGPYRPDDFALGVLDKYGSAIYNKMGEELKNRIEY